MTKVLKTYETCVSAVQQTQQRYQLSDTVGHIITNCIASF